MKKIEWLLALLLILIGLSCLTVSGTMMMGSESIDSYIHTFMQLCLWMGIPVVIIGIAYIVIKKKKK